MAYPSQTNARFAPPAGLAPRFDLAAGLAQVGALGEPETSADCRERQQQPRRISSALLLAGASEVQIEHHGALYRLRQTSLGKLILTK